MEKSRTWLAPLIVFIAALFVTIFLIYAYRQSENVVRYLIAVIIVYYVFQTINVIVIFTSSRHAAARESWLAITLILPFFGTILYIIFGRRYKYRKKNERYLEVNSWWRDNQVPTSSSFAKLKSAPSYNRFQKIAILSDKRTHACEVEMHDGGEVAYKKMFDAMRSAKKFIFAEVYIIKPGEIYEQFKEIAITKAKEGVDVRLIVDDFGRWALPWYSIRELQKSGIKIAIYGQTRFPFIGADNGYRSHRKFVIVDNELVIAGGLNISDEYAHFSKKYGYWADLNFSIKGGAIQDFSMLFIADWFRITQEKLDVQSYEVNSKPPKNSTSDVILIESGPDNTFSAIQSQLISLIYRSSQRVWLTTPYFVPTEEFIQALQNAATRGVDVKIFIPGRPDKKSVYLSTTHFASDLSEYGVEFWKLNDIFLHSKAGICDDVSFAGTVNIDMRSFYAQFEIECFFLGKATLDIEKIFQEYMTFSTKSIFPEWRKISLYNKFKEVIIKLFLPVQ